MSAVSLSPREIARALGGDVVAGGVIFPAPGHSRADRSASVRFDPTAPGGFVVNSFAGDDPLPIRDHVREVLHLPRDHRTVGMPTPVPAASHGPPDAARLDVERTTRALALWPQSRPPEGTPVQAYLESRGLALPDGAEEAIRFHRLCPFAGKKVPAMVALVRDIITDAPRAVHRTALSLEGRKVEIDGKDRLALGPIAGGAVKITADPDVTLCLGIGEGIESTLSLRELPEFGASPVWALLSAGGVAAFPVLSGIECLWIAVDRDPAGERAAHACAERWRAAGREVFLVKPKAERADLNDIAMKKGRRHDAR
jgi:hypothetical protein